MPKLPPVVKNIWLILGVVLVLIIGGYFVYGQYQIRQEKQRFDQARTNLDELYNKIVDVVGEPDNSKSTQSCGRPNLKYNQGPLSCHLNFAVVYPVDTHKNALNLAQQVQDILDADNNFEPDQNSDSNITLPVSIDTYRNTPSNIDCKVKYAFDSPYDISLNLSATNRSAKPLYVSVSCSSSAKKEYY